MKKKNYRRERKNKERRFEETDSGTESEVDEKKNQSSEHMLFDELMKADTNNFYHL
jgi:hypothetical protein